MVSLEEVQMGLASRQQMLEQAQQQTEAYKPQIERTQQMLRSPPQGTSAATQQVRLGELERLRGLAKEQALADIQQQKTELSQVQTDFTNYMNTDAGKLQYVQENQIAPTTYESRYVDELGTTVRIPVYETPFGTVKDESVINTAAERIAGQEAKEYGFSSPQAYQSFMQFSKYVGTKQGESPSGVKFDYEKGIAMFPEKMTGPAVNERGQVVLEATKEPSVLDVKEPEIVSSKGPSGEIHKLTTTNKIEFLLNTARQKYAQVFKGAEPDEQSIIKPVSASTFLEVPLAVASAPILALERGTKILSGGATAAIEKVAPNYTGATLKTQPIKVYTHQTGGERIIESKEIKVLTPSQIGTGLTVGALTIGSLGLGSTTFAVLGGSQIAKGTSTLINPQATGQEKVMGVLDIGLGAVAVVPYLKQPVIEKLPPRFTREEIITSKGGWFVKEGKVPVKYSLKETLVPIRVGEEDLTAVSFALRRDTPAQYAKTYPNRISKLLFEGKTVQVKAPRTDFAATPYPILVNEKGNIVGSLRGRDDIGAALVGSKRVGAGMNTIFKVEGGGIKVESAMGSKLLTKQDPFMVGGEGAELYEGSIQSTKLARITPAKGGSTDLTLFNPGRKVSRFDTLTMSSPILRNEEYSIYGLKIKARDVTFPKKYYRSEPIEIKGYSKVYNEGPNTQGVSEDIFTNADVNLKVAKVSKTTTETIRKIEVQSIKQLPRVKSPVSLTKNVELESPFYVGGSSRVLGTFAGTMKYEKTQSMMAPMIGQTKVQEDITIVSPVSKMQAQTITIGTQEERTTLVPFTGIIPDETQIVSPRVNEDIITGQANMLQSRQAQQTKTSQITQTTLPLVPDVITPRPKVKIRVPRIKLKKRGNPPLSKTSKKVREMFIPEVKIKGKLTGISKPLSTIREAEAVALRRVKSRLEASFAIRSTATGKEVKLNLPGAGFRYSKKSPFVVVQTRGTRLGTPSEKREIIASRSGRSRNVFGV